MNKVTILKVLCALVFLTISTPAFPQVDFYAGKTLLMVIGTDAGGNGDLRTKAIIPALRKHIPGHPPIVVQYMPGAGGRRAANHMHAAVRPDGLTIGAMVTGMIQGAILGESGILYDIDKFIYLGSHARYAPYALISRKAAGFSDLKKLSGASDVRIGAPAVGHSLYVIARLFAYFLDLKEPRFVTGYTARELDIVLESGEVDARVSIVDSTIQRNPHWFEKDLVNVHALLDIPKDLTHAHARFANQPDLEKFAKSARERRFIELFRAMRGTGQPFVVPPGTPADPVRILRDAMRKALKDPQYLKEYEKLVAEPAMPMMPEDFDKALKDVPREAELVELFKKFAGAGPLSPR